MGASRPVCHSIVTNDEVMLAMIADNVGANAINQGASCIAEEPTELTTRYLEKW